MTWLTPQQDTLSLLNHLSFTLKTTWRASERETTDLHFALSWSELNLKACFCLFTHKVPQAGTVFIVACDLLASLMDSLAWVQRNKKETMILWDLAWKQESAEINDSDIKPSLWLCPMLCCDGRLHYTQWSLMNMWLSLLRWLDGYNGLIWHLGCAVRRIIHHNSNHHELLTRNIQKS